MIEQIKQTLEYSKLSIESFGAEVTLSVEFIDQISNVIGEVEGYKKHYLDFEEMYKQEHREKNALKRQVEKLQKALEQIKYMPSTPPMIRAVADQALERSKSK